MDPILDILTYLAKFPDREGVLKNFSKTSEKIAGYNALKAEIEAMPAAVFPQIKDFVFTTDSEELRNRIKTCSSWFMIFEYGPIRNNGKNSMNVREHEWLFSITIAHPGNARNHDSMEEALLSNEALKLTYSLIDAIDTDDKNRCASGRLLNKPFDVSPIEPVMLFGCFGWVMSFIKTATNLNF